MQHDYFLKLRKELNMITAISPAMSKSYTNYQVNFGQRIPQHQILQQNNSQTVSKNPSFGITFLRAYSPILYLLGAIAIGGATTYYLERSKISEAHTICDQDTNNLYADLCKKFKDTVKNQKSLDETADAAGAVIEAFERARIKKP